MGSIRRPFLNPKPLVLAIHLVTFSVAVIPLFAHAAPAQVNIPAGNLAQVLNRYALEQGVNIVFDSGLFSGIQSRGIKGTYEINDGFTELLKNTGYQIKQTSSGYRLEEKSKNPKKEEVVKLTPLQSKANQSRHSALGASSGSVLPTITATAQATARTEGTNAYTTPKVTTGKFTQSIRETPQSISVMTRKQMDDQNITNLKQAMSEATGVTVTTNGAYAETGYQMRGYTAIQQQDGLSVGADESYSIAPPRDMEIYDRVEILRGPAGLLEGSGDPSGVINMVRRKPTADAEGFVNLSYGSWNNKRVSVGANNRLNESGTVRGRVILTHQDKDFFYDYAHENRNSAYAIVETDLTDKTLLTTAINYSQSDSIPFYGWPPHGGGFSRKSYFGADWNKTEVPNAFEGRVDVEHSFNDDWKLKLSTIYQNLELNSQMAIATTPDITTQTTSYYGYKKESKEALYGSELSLSGKFNLFHREHDIILGSTWSSKTSKIGSSSNYDNDSASAYWNSDTLTHPHVSPDDIPDPNLNKNEEKITKSSLYGAIKYKLLDNLTLTLGGRFSNYDLKNRGIGADNASDWVKSAAKADMKFSPYSGLVWDFSDNFSWYASYTDIFSPQSQQDWQGNTLDPRVGWQIETGIKGSFFDDNLQSALSLFRIKDKNRATPDLNSEHYPNNYCQGDPTDPTTFGCSMSGGEYQTQGVELELTGKLTEHWNVIASYVFTDSEVLSTNSTEWWEYAVGSNFAPYIPKHAFKLWSTYDFDNGLTLGGGLNAQSHLYDSTTSQRNGGYTVFNAYANYKINPNLDLALNLNNIFDKSYFSGMGYGANRWFYGEPRNYMLTLRAKF